MEESDYEFEMMARQFWVSVYTQSAPGVGRLRDANRAYEDFKCRFKPIKKSVKPEACD